MGRFSYLILGLVLLLGCGGFEQYRHATPSVIVMSEAVVLGLWAIVWIAGHRVDAYKHPDKALRKLVGHGRPVVLHFYSDFSMGSLVQRMLLARRERKFQGRVQFVYLNLSRASARDMAEKLEARLGDFVLFDAAGHERARAWLPKAGQLQELTTMPGR